MIYSTTGVEDPAVIAEYTRIFQQGTMRGRDQFQLRRTLVPVRHGPVGPGAHPAGRHDQSLKATAGYDDATGVGTPSPWFLWTF